MYLKQQKKNICVFQFSRPYLGFSPNTKNFILNCEQNIVKYAENWVCVCVWGGGGGVNVVKSAISTYKIFWLNEMIMPTDYT